MSDTVFALIIEVVGDAILLPNAATAEVAGLDNFEVAGKDAPKWIAGWHSSADRRIPVLSFEALSGRAPAEPGKRSRIVMINPMGQRMASGGFALLAKDQPHLATVKQDNIAAVGLRPTDRDELVLSRVKINGQEAIIPDLEFIETQLASLA